MNTLIECHPSHRLTHEFTGHITEFKFLRYKIKTITKLLPNWTNTGIESKLHSLDTLIDTNKKIHSELLSGKFTVPVKLEGKDEHKDCS